MNFLGFINFGTQLSPEALCPLAEPLPLDSLGVAGVQAAGLTTELATRFLEGEGGLSGKEASKQILDIRK